MDSLDADGLENAVNDEKQVGKLRRSCELCRASKGRCIPSKDEPNKCQRCLKERKPCIFLEAKPRPKRAKNSRLRVAEMEKKLDGLYALLSSAGQGSKEVTSPRMQPSTPSLPEAQPTDLVEFSPSRTAPHIRMDIPKFSQQYPIWSFPFFVLDDIQDVISKGIVSFEEAEESLRRFRTKACTFPFVVISPQTSLDTLRREKPFLLLAILTFSAQESLKLQRTLELELRESLSRKSIVNGEKSIDLLQGILVYIAWYYFHFNPERNQIYQLSQMAASMATDLGIGKPLQCAAPLTNFAILNVSPQVFVERKSPEEMERRRTFLGAYYISSSICLGLRKPNSLKYGDYVEDCCQILAQVAGAETDCLLRYFIDLQRFAEDVNHAFDYNGAIQHPQLDSVRVEILVKSFKQQLDQLHSSFPPHVWENTQIAMSYHFLRIYINEVGFHARPPSALELLSGNSTLRAWYLSTARSESLIACLQAAKDFLDRYLEIPSCQLLNLTLTDYLRLVYAILILGRFTAGCDSPAIDTVQVRKSAILGYYLDGLISKTDDLISLAMPLEQEHYLFHIRKLWKNSKMWFNEIAQNPTPITNFSSGQPELAFMEILPSIIGRCVDFSGTIGCDEKYMDMFCEWSGSLDPSIITMNEN